MSTEAQIEIARIRKRPKIANSTKKNWENVLISDENILHVKENNAWEILTNGSGRKSHEAFGGWGLYALQMSKSHMAQPRRWFSKGGTVGGCGTNMMGELAGLSEALSFALEVARSAHSGYHCEYFSIHSPNPKPCVDFNTEQTNVENMNKRISDCTEADIECVFEFSPR